MNSIVKISLSSLLIYINHRYAETIGIRVREMPEPTKWNAKERAWLAKAKASVALKRTEKEIEEDYQRDVKNVFDALIVHAKEVKKNGFRDRHHYRIFDLEKSQ